MTSLATLFSKNYQIVGNILQQNRKVAIPAPLIIIPAILYYPYCNFQEQFCTTPTATSAFVWCL